MNNSMQKVRRQTHLAIQEVATEPQALIGWGEQFLDHAHRVAHGIEEHVRRLLNSPMNSPSPTSPNRSDPT